MTTCGPSGRYGEMFAWLLSFVPEPLALPDGRPVCWFKRTEIEALARQLVVALPAAVRSFHTLTGYVAKIRPSGQLPNPIGALANGMLAWLIAHGELAPDFRERAERGPAADDGTF